MAEEEVAEEQQDQTSSTTEAPKKFIKSGIVRPFRSNDDLLATLKRRREQAANSESPRSLIKVFFFSFSLDKLAAKSAQATDTAESAPAPVHNEPASKAARPSSNGRRNRYSKKENNAEPAEEQNSSTAAPARTGRRFNNRS